MSDRKKLQLMLEEILGSKHVYYQPPETIKMEYPAIVYSRSDVDIKHANNRPYTNKNRYTITVIDRKPDSDTINKLLQMPLCMYDRHYVSNNLNHDTLSLYY